MRTVTYKLADLKKAVIHLGKVAENDATQVRIDSEEVFRDYPAAQVALSVTNPVGETYPATVQRDGDFVVWDVKDSSLTAEGDGEIQIRFSQSGAKIRSEIGKTKICRSIVEDGEAPDPVKDWVDQAEEVLEEVEDAIPGGGTTGQVLAKASDEDYDLEWVDQTGGGGGTSDYNQLENRPQIGGVTLTGDKSLHDLGAAAENDIPDVSGFYTKPAGGIPASDLADGVIPDVSGFYTKPAGGIPASDIAAGVIPDPEDMIDDTAGDGDTDKVWSADKSAEERTSLLSAFNGYLYGVEKAFQGVASSINKFDFVMIQGIEYTVTNGTSGTIGLDIWQADGTKKTISGQITAGNSFSFTPDRDDYVQFGGWVNAAGTITISSDYSAIEKISDLETDGVETKSDLTTLSGMVDTLTKEEPINITEEATKHENEFYNVNNAFYSGGNQWDYYSLEATAGDTFTIDTVAGGTVRGWAFRDTSGNQLSIASYNGDVVQKEYTNVIAPANASELLVNFKHVSGYLTIIRNDLLVLNENRIFYNGIPLSKYLDRLTEKSNILHGKVLCCCGDSITYGADLTGDDLVTPEIESYQWNAYTKQWTKWTADEPAAYGYQIAQRNDMIFYNGGESGACMQGSGGTSTVPGFSVADGEYTLLPDSIDYLTIFFGWNDAATGSLGTINDTTNDSYYGGYNVVLPYLIDKYPYTKIALIVPFGTDAEHRQAIRDLANKWGVACFDMMQGGTPLYWGKEADVDVDADIVTANRQKFSAQANSPHPNVHGHYQISTMLEAFLRGI